MFAVQKAPVSIRHHEMLFTMSDCRSSLLELVSCVRMLVSCKIVLLVLSCLSLPGLPADKVAQLQVIAAYVAEHVSACCEDRCPGALAASQTYNSRLIIASYFRCAAHASTTPFLIIATISLSEPSASASASVYPTNSSGLAQDQTSSWIRIILSQSSWLATMADAWISSQHASHGSRHVHWQ